MKTTIRGVYEDPTQVRNTRDELINAGIPQELIHVDKATHIIRVILPEEEESEVLEIFDRHDVKH